MNESATCLSLTGGSEETEAEAPYEPSYGIQTPVNRDVTDSLSWQRVIVDADSVVHNLTDDELQSTQTHFDRLSS